MRILGTPNALNGRKFRMEWSGFFSYVHTDATTHQSWRQISRKFHEFPLHQLDGLHVHILGRHATISAMLYRDHC